MHSGNKVLKVTGWEHAQGPQGPLQLALLIDENIRTTLIAEQLNDIANFIQNKAPSTEVSVYYAENGSAYAAAPFTTDHQRRRQALPVHDSSVSTPASRPEYLSFVERFGEALANEAKSPTRSCRIRKR